MKDLTIESIKLKITSGNNIPVKQVTLPAAEINCLLEQLTAKDKEVNELKKKRTVGQINEAYAKTIEDNKDEISWYKRKLNEQATKLGSRVPVYKGE